MEIENDDITALIGTIIIHVIALILLYMGVMRIFALLGDGGTPLATGIQGRLRQRNKPFIQSWRTSCRR